jgi:hypothetical protein
MAGRDGFPQPQTQGSDFLVAGYRWLSSLSFWEAACSTDFSSLFLYLGPLLREITATGRKASEAHF